MEKDFHKTYIIPAPYLGLQNIGATCYMNSILQTLFMTPEFRRGIFSWTYTDTDANEKDSIPYQLQRIFGRLQVKTFEYMDTRDLIKSFQWNVSQAFEQHDIQEFMRVLFDAIEQSLEPTDFNFVKELYEGIILNYTRCLKCGYEGTRQENFLDYSVLVKNKWEKIYNDSLEKGLQVSMKTELLNGSNQYFCEMCQSKQDAQRGTRFLKMPSQLCLQISRFTFDYMTMRRQKLDDLFSFPYALNMNNYMNGYEGIPNKLSEESDPSVWEDNMNKKPTSSKPAPKATAVTTLPFPPIPDLNKQGSSQTKKVAPPPKKNVAASSQTRSFLDDIKKRKKEAKIDDKDKIEIYESHDSQMQMAIEKSLSESQASHTPSSLGGTPMLEEAITPVNENNTSSNTTPPPPPPPPPKQIDDSSKLENIKTKVEQQEMEIEKDFNLEDDRKKYFEFVTRQTEQHNKDQDELIKQYLKDGEYVYQLYSILNHQGGAYGGHYFAFIKSFENGRWYCFNDGNVTGIEPNEIPKRAFGGSSNNSAYMLFYRKVNSEQENFSTWGGQFAEEDLPQRIQAKIQAERDQLKEYLEKGGSVEGLSHNIKTLTLKVYFKLEYKLIQLQSIETFEALQKQAFKEFDIKDTVNCRLRGYQAHSDLLTDSYTGKEQLTLNELKIQTYKAFSFEFRQDSSVEWVEYDSNVLNLRFTMWNDTITNGDENLLQKHKIVARKEWKLSQVVDHIKQTVGIVNQDLLICRRINDFGFDIVKALDQSQRLDQLDIQESWVLYAELATEPSNSQWAKQFDVDAHSVTIRCNHPDGIIPETLKEGHPECQPNDEFPYLITIDNRKTLEDLKHKICQQLNLDVMDVILRRGSRAGLEIKDLKAEIELSHLVKGSSIYLERGCPLNQGEYRTIICLSERKLEVMEDNNIYYFKEIGEYPIHGDKLLSLQKQGLFQWLSKKTQTEYNPSEYRLRERISERLTKVYRDRPLKEQGIVEKRMIAVEKLLTNQNEWLTARECLILLRFWDQSNWTLSETKEVIIQKNDNTLDLAKQIHELFPHVQPENMEACRIVAIYRFNRYDLFSQEWYSLNSEEYLLGSQPLHLTNDGLMLVIRDNTQEQRQLTEEEQKQFGIIQSQYAQKTKVGHTKVLTSPAIQIQEKALKITVKRKEQQTEAQDPQL